MPKDNNPFLKRNPGAVRMPGNINRTPQEPLIGRITIDVKASGTSLSGEGPFTVLTIIDILIGQLTGLWKQFAADAAKNAVLVDPKTGLPLAAGTSPGAAGAAKDAPNGTGETSVESEVKTEGVN